MSDPVVQEIARRLGRQLSPELRDGFSDQIDAVREEWEHDKQAGKREALRVAEKIEQVLAAAPGRRGQRPPERRHEAPRLVRQDEAPTVEKVQSWLLAVSAKEWPSVVAYRAAHLSDGLLSTEDAAGQRNVVVWLRDRLAEERPKSDVWHTFLDPLGALLSFRRANPWDRRTTEREWRQDRGQRVPGVADLAPAEALLLVVDELLRAYPWNASQATYFVLAGSVPWVEQVRTSLAAHTADVAGCHRIELSIDPSVDPVEVARLYRAARRSVRQGNERASRELPDKKLYLAWLDLARQYRGDPRPTNREQMAQWNEWVRRDHPEKVAYKENGQKKSWLYTVDTNFARDRSDALKRIQRARARTDIPFTIGGTSTDG